MRQRVVCERDSTRCRQSARRRDWASAIVSADGLGIGTLARHLARAFEHIRVVADGGRERTLSRVAARTGQQVENDDGLKSEQEQQDALGIRLAIAGRQVGANRRACSGGRLGE